MRSVRPRTQPELAAILAAGLTPRGTWVWTVSARVVPGARINSSQGTHALPTPFLGRDVRHRLGERPHVAAGVLDRVLALAERIRLRRAHDPGAAPTDLLVVFVDVPDAHHDGVGALLRAGVSTA